MLICKKFRKARAAGNKRSNWHSEKNLAAPDAANDALLHAWIHSLSLIAGMCIIAAVPRSRRQFGFGAEWRLFFFFLTPIQPLDVSVLPFSRMPGYLTKSRRWEGPGACCEEVLRSCEWWKRLAGTCWQVPMVFQSCWERGGGGGGYPE